MIGYVFAVIASAGMGLTGVVVRRGVLSGSPAMGTLVTVLLGIPLFAAAAAMTGQFGKMEAFSGGDKLALAVIGILQFGLARYSFYRSIRALGANQAELVQMIQIPVAAAIAIIILGEQLVLQTAIGAGLVLAGPVLIIIARGSVLSGSGIAIQFKEGLFFGMVAVGAFAVGDNLARSVLSSTGSPLFGGLLAYIGAATALVLVLLGRGEFRALPATIIESNRWFLLGALISFVAQMSRYVALSLAPVTIVVPVMRAVPVFTLAFSYLFNRKIDVFNARVVAGIGLAFAGLIVLAM
jgi:drug/metabolite transporter (DMT)-like permease